MEETEKLRFQFFQNIFLGFDFYSKYNMDKKNISVQNQKWQHFCETSPAAGTFRPCIAMAQSSKYQTLKTWSGFEINTHVGVFKNRVF